MTSEQVPDELAELLGQKLYDEQSEGCAAPGCQGHPGPVECRNWARDLLAAVLPAEIYVAEVIWFEENPVDGRTRIAVCATLDGALDALREHHILGGDLVATEAEHSALGTATARTWAVHERGSDPDDEGHLWITGEPMAFAANIARGESP